MWAGRRSLLYEAVWTSGLTPVGRSYWSILGGHSGGRVELEMEVQLCLVDSCRVDCKGLCVYVASYSWYCMPSYSEGTIYTSCFVQSTCAYACLAVSLVYIYFISGLVFPCNGPWFTECDGLCACRIFCK